MPKRILWAVFLISLCVLMFEISLVRLFSVLMRYHYVFLIVSMSMCGLGFGGIVYFYTREKIKNPVFMMYCLTVITGVTIPLSVILIFKTPLKDFLAGYTGISMIPFIPFLFAGAFFSCVFEIFGNYSGRIYFADLCGAGAGCIITLLFIDIFGGINIFFIIGALIIIGAIVLVGKTFTKRGMIPSILVLCAIVVCLLINMNNKFFEIPYIANKNPNIIKPLFSAIEDSGSIVYTEWNAFARTDVVEFPDIPDIKYIYTDGDVPTTMHFFDGTNESIKSIKNTVFSLPFADLEKPKVLSIGPGGGVDILVSILGGSTDITGVEVNPSMFSIMDKYSSFNGNLYRYPGVKVYLDDGRSFVRRSRDKYDLIYLALTQTATGQTQAGVLTEGYIHTQQAFIDYFEKLKGNGMLVFITQNELLLFRGLVTVLTILNRPHSPGLEKTMVFMVPEALFETTPYRYILVAGNEKFSHQRIMKMKALADKSGIITVFAPGLAAKPPFDKLETARSAIEIIRIINSQIETPVNLFPAYDDSPFFLDLSFGILPQVKKLLLMIIFAAILCGILAVRPFYRKNEAMNILLFFSVYFATIGVAYMLIEIAMIQKFILFLGHPTFAVSIILFSLLAGSGMGSFASQFWKKNLLEKIMITGLLTGFVIGFYVFSLGKIFDALLYQTKFVRTLASIALVFPAGFLMGMFFPSGIKILNQYQPHSIPWMWAINGLMSVCGSVVAMVIGKIDGFAGAFACGGAGYILIFLMCAAARSKRLNVFS